MTEKQSILGRIAQLRSTDIGSVLASTLDPGTMLDQFVRDLTAAIAEAEEAISVSEANLRLAQLDREEDRSAARIWAEAAQSAWDKGDELRARLENSEPTPFDALAENARAKQYAAEGAAAAVDSLVAAQTEAVTRLNDGLAALRTTLKDVKANRHELVASAAAVVGGVPSSTINLMDPTSDMELFRAQLESMIERELTEPDTATDIEEHLDTESEEAFEDDAAPEPPQESDPETEPGVESEAEPDAEPEDAENESQA